MKQTGKISADLKSAEDVGEQLREKEQRSKHLETRMMPRAKKN